MAGDTTLGLVVAAVTMVIAVLVFANIYGAVDNTLATENLTGSGYGVYTLTYAPIVTGTDAVYNVTQAQQLIRDTHYTINYNTRVINITDPGSIGNTFINYSYGSLTVQAAATTATINTTAYAAFALIVISLIIIAAALILRYTGMLGGGRT